MKKILLFPFFVIGSSFTIFCQSYSINTFAGNGIMGYSGDGGMAVNAELSAPSGIAFDNSGNMYIVDGLNYRIREVNHIGIISTFAGNGVFGFFGDGGPATSAEIDSVYGIAVDNSGNVYIADASNQRIRMVNNTGFISTIAGNGYHNFGNGGYSGDGGPAISAELNWPYGVAVDSSANLYIADCYNSRVRKVNSSGIISTFAGNGYAGYSGDGGAATLSELSGPVSVMINLNNVYFTDELNECIREVNALGIISTVGGNYNFGAGYSGDGGSATSAELNFPWGIAKAVSGYWFICDQVNWRVRMVDNGGTISTIAGNGIQGYNGDGISATSAELNWPQDIKLDASGNIYIADAGNNRIRILNINTGLEPLNNDYSKLTTFPNPFHTSTVITINSPDPILNNYYLELYDIEGRKLQTIDFKGDNYQLSAVNYQLAQGMYFVRVFDEKKNVVGSSKIVRQ